MAGENDTQNAQNTAQQQQQQQQTELATGDPELEARLDQMVSEGNGETDDAQTQTQGSQETGAQQQTPSNQQQQQTTGAPDQGQQAAQQQQQPTPQPLDPEVAALAQGRLKADAKGNLIGPDGGVVAAAGKERRLYEALVKAQQIEIPKLRNDLAEATRNAQGVQALNGVPQQLGLSGDDAVQAMRFMASYKQDPIGTIRQILAEAKANGHDLGQIGVGQVLDTQAIHTMIAQQLAPLMQDRQVQQQEVQIQGEAEQQYATFVAQYPDVRLHEDVIANLLQRNPQMSPEAAYFNLKMFAQQHNLDWSQPLRDQIIALQQGQQQQQNGQQGAQQNQQQPQNGVKQQAPLNPRSGNADVNTQQQAQQQQTVSANAETGDIVKEAMREAGLTIQ